MVLIGIAFQPDRRYLELLGPLLESESDYLVVAPETLWRTTRTGEIVPNGYHAELRSLVSRTGKPVVAHGVGLSLGSVDPADRARQRRWLELIARDHEVFSFLWYTDHLGVTVLGGRAITLPIALAMNETMAEVVRDRLVELQSVVPDVGFENSVFYFLLGEWLDEPDFFRQILTPPRTHLLLDLHNVFTMAVNQGVDPAEYVRRLDLSSVIEIHLSGGSTSDPAWLPDGRTIRLDSHDHAVPSEVWQLYEDVAPLCRNLRGVTLERLEGTVEEGDVEVLRRELERAREVVRGNA